MSTAPVPWRTVRRERHVLAPRTQTWEALVARLGEDEGDLSVEPPWRHVRRFDGGEATVAIRDDGDQSHLAWCAGTTADEDEAEGLLAGLAAEAEDLLAGVAEAAESASP